MKCGNTGFYNSLSKANIPLLMQYLDVSLCSVYNDSYFACLCTNQDLLKYLKRKYRFIYHNYAVLKGYGKIKTQRPKSVFFSKCPAIEMFNSNLMSVKHMQMHLTQMFFAGLLNI